MDVWPSLSGNVIPESNFSLHELELVVNSVFREMQVTSGQLGCSRDVPQVSRNEPRSVRCPPRCPGRRGCVGGRGALPLCYLLHGSLDEAFLEWIAVLLHFLSSFRV